MVQGNFILLVLLMGAQLAGRQKGAALSLTASN